MDYTIEKNRIYAEDENRKIIAEILFPQTEETIYTITRTFVDNSLRGKGVAGELMKMAVKEIKKQGKTVNATCSYAVKWLEKQN